MINLLTPKAKLILLSLFLGVLPVGCTSPTTTNGCLERNKVAEENPGCIQVTNWKTEGEIVQLKVKVFNEANTFNSDLKAEDFQVETKDDFGISLKPIKPAVVLPKNSNPAPADIIILLDMSGSMKHQDARGGQKLAGAIDAIEKFIDAVNQDYSLNVRISLVPFGEQGEEGEQCSQYDTSVTETNIEKNFFASTDQKLKYQLQEIKNVENLCASTNLYRPLATAINYLRNKSSVVGNLESNASGEVAEKQLVVILLSDGFHNYQREREENQFQELSNLLTVEPVVTVHTLGYGEPLIDLYKNSQCNTSFTEEQLTQDQLTINEKIIDKIIASCRRLDNPNTSGVDNDESQFSIDQYIVDAPRLKAIANLTGGIYKFSEDGTQVSESLITFLESLREYQVTYRQPGADRASQHQTFVRVIPNNLASNQISIRMCNIGCPPLSLDKRLAFLIVSLIVFSLLVIWPFLIWSSKLKMSRFKK